MSAEGMNDFTAAQKIESESSISEIRNTVLTIRTLAESPDIDPEGEVFTDFLDSWNERSSFGVTYVSIATLEEGVDDSNRKESDREILRRLKAGESVVSDVRKSNRLDGYFYSIAEPVVKDNMVVGVLRSIVDAHTLIDTTQIKSSVTLLGSVLMKGDGTIIVDSEKSELYDGSNLYDVLRSQGYADAIVNKMQENVENDSDVATLAIGKRNGKTTFFTSVRLNENDWTIVNFTEENTIAEHSQVILHDTVVAGTVLVVISTIACIVVALVIGRFRRRALREADRYAVLAEFSDTVLFEYSYSDDVLELTPNARSVFSLDSLRREHYLERGIPLIDFHEEDVSLVGEILENPAPSGEARHAIVRARTLTGEYRWFSIKCRYLYEGQEPYAAVGKMVDITQQRALEEQLVRQSQIDGLTKALNKVMLATMSISGFFKFYAVISFAVPLLILGLPIFDTVSAITRRVLEGRSPMSPDRGHVHHRLVDMGFNVKQAVAILYAISGTLGLAAVVLTTSGEAKAMLLLLAAILAIAVGAWILVNRRKASKESIERILNEPSEEAQTSEQEEQQDGKD